MSFRVIKKETPISLAIMPIHIRTGKGKKVDLALLKKTVVGLTRYKCYRTVAEATADVGGDWDYMLKTGETAVDDWLDRHGYGQTNISLIRIENMGLRPETTRVLESNGIKTVGRLEMMTRSQIKTLKGVDETSLGDILDQCHELDVRLAR